MDSLNWNRLYRPWLVAMTALTVFACDGGGCSSCEGCGVQPIPGGYPIDQRIENSAQVRLTESGIGFIEDNIEQIIGILLEDGLTFDIPRVSGSESGISYDVCRDEDCAVQIEIDSLQISPTAPNRLIAHIRVILDSRESPSLERRHIPVRVNPPILPAATCRLDLDTRRGSRPYVGLIADLELAAETRPARLGYTHVIFRDVDLAPGEDIEDADLTISGCTGYAWLLNLFKGTLINTLQDSISDILDDALAEQLCTRRGEFGCPTGTHAVPDEDPDSICRFEPSGDADCVPTLLGTDGRGDLGGALLGGTSPGTHAYGQFLLASGGDGEAVNNGMSLFFFGGFMGTDRAFTQTPAHHSCVPVTTPPPLPTIPRTDAFRGNVIPGTSQETHVGIGIAEDYLNYAGWGLFDSGMLCIGAGTRLSQQLSTGLFSALISSLNDLTFPSNNAALAISLRPQAAPVFDVGTAAGEPLLGITLPQVEIDFYVWSTERYIRFMTLRTDLIIDLDLEVDGGQIVPRIGRVATADATVRNSELLEERPEQVAMLLGTVIESFAGMLTDGLGGFDLPSIMGFELEVPEGGIRGVREGSADFLGIFANLRLAAMPYTATIDTRLSLSDLTIDEASMAVETWGQGEGNHVWLHFDADGPNGVRYEYSYRINGGAWSHWTTEPRVLVSDRILLLQARHLVEARARVVGEPLSVDTTPARADLIIDILPPTITVERTNDAVIAHGSDVITPTEALEYRFSVDGEWTEWGRRSRIDAPFDNSEVLVEVRDEAGNIGQAQAALIRGLPNAEDEACGCRAPGASSSRLPLGGLLLLGVLGVFGLRRRRRNRGLVTPGLLTLGLGAIALLASGCDCSGPMELGPCGDACRAASPPATTGNICCESTDMCIDYDLEALCDPGFVCTPAGVDLDESCGVSCSDCQRQPALQPGILATHLDSALDAAGNVWVSGYSPGVSAGRSSFLYGDLVLGSWDGTSVDWQVVDGAPSSPITNDPDGWRGGVSAPGDDVGLWTSLLVTDSGFLIAYHDRTNGALKFASGSPGAWSIHTVDDRGNSGRYASMVQTPTGPAIAYLRIEPSPDIEGQVVSSVQVARASSASPGSAADWTITEVAAGPMACRPAFCATGARCLENGLCVTPTSDCPESCGSGRTCFNGSCQASLPNDYVEDLPPAYGLYTSLAVNGSGLALVFYDRTSGNVMGAAFDGSSWDTPFLIDGYAVGDPFTGDSGQSADLFVDDAGTWHVAYVDGAEETLRYARVVGGTVEERVMVDDGSTDGVDRHMDGRHIVGDDASIVVTAGGQVRIVYQDATAHRSVIATRDGAGGDFAITHFDTEPHSGFWVDQELVGDTSYVVTFWRARMGRMTSNGIRVFTLD